VKVVGLNIEQNPETPARFQVRAIPNLLVIKGGRVAEQIIGAVPKSRLVTALDRVL